MNVLKRVGTTYIPVNEVQAAVDWYVKKLEAELSYRDEDKAIIHLANQSFFLVRAKEGESANFIDHSGQTRFSLTFEVDGVQQLEVLHQELNKRFIKTGEIEDRGHPGRNFVFYDLDGNLFDVWSELSPGFRK
ncbi:VOC family protein [Alkalihalobacillus pseudalcaliphilus]|uniref:VOC family protein n=1 Tax=Alkalihalobacillus pseudalcaliphilus TaxID=79884 RepID=UPI00064D912D|nr:VOC family protein [Alkalihalobacillus pseudalcaliphilus]KMK76824.1 glyoxalase [Alkalihalobacillus pseudalcaliphilus]